MHETQLLAPLSEGETGLGEEAPLDRSFTCAGPMGDLFEPTLIAGIVVEQLADATSPRIFRLRQMQRCGPGDLELIEDHLDETGVLRIAPAQLAEFHRVQDELAEQRPDRQRAAARSDGSRDSRGYVQGAHGHRARDLD